MKISEFIAVLEERKERWGDIEVVAQWESTFHEIDQDNIYRFREGPPEFNFEPDSPCLIIDAYENFYKADYAEDAQEGEE